MNNIAYELATQGTRASARCSSQTRTQSFSPLVDTAWAPRTEALAPAISKVVLCVRRVVRGGPPSLPISGPGPILGCVAVRRSCLKWAEYALRFDPTEADTKEMARVFDRRRDDAELASTTDLGEVHEIPTLEEPTAPVLPTPYDSGLGTDAFGEDGLRDTDGDFEVTARRFWLTHMRIGFGAVLGESLVMEAYLALTPHGHHRSQLWIIATSWSVLTATNLGLSQAVSYKSWRATFSVTWTILSALAVGGVAGLDGGIHSPMLVLLFLPMGYAAWAFTPFAAAGCGVSSLVSLAFVEALNGDVQTFKESTLPLWATLVGTSVLSVAAARNRTRREHHEALLACRIVELATIDGLTGCVVHRVLHQRFKEELARTSRHGRPLSLLMIDLDNFKRVNDTYGHLVGDHILAAIGSALRACSRSCDLVGRLGGDEFAVLMPETDRAAAVALAERIRNEIPKMLEVPVTFSVGVSELNTSTPTTEQMLDDADIALYQAKRGGRDAVAVFSGVDRASPSDQARGA